MGFWSNLLGIDSYDAAQRVLQAPYEPFISTAGIPVMDPGSPLDYWTRADLEDFWRTQPNLRKVIGFVARSVATIPLHTHERVSDTERKRITDHKLPRTLSRPQPRVGAYRFWESVLSDGLLYDRWAVMKEWQDDGSIHLVQVPSWRLRFRTDPLRRVTDAAIWVGDSTEVEAVENGWVHLDLDNLIFDHGYAPRTAGLSPVETLKDILDEGAEAVQYRRDVWKNGGRASQYIKRPMDAKWSPEHRQRFVSGLRKFKAGGGEAGGFMLLEDGMEAGSLPHPLSKDVHDLEGRELSAAEVASAFYVAPELIGIREGNFSNVDAFRQSLYRDSLGPYITAWEQAVNIGLTDDLAEGRNLYVEANVESKLRGSFLEQAQVAQSVVGAPSMTRNEYRALQNQPPIEGGDDLVVPLNVLVGGQASPRDSGSQNRTGTASTSELFAKHRGVTAKAGPTSNHTRKAEQVLSAFFRRQGRSVQTQINAGDDDWWDGDRWDQELSEDISALYLLTATAAGQATLESVGISPEEYNEPRTMAFLRESARRSAGSINGATRNAVREALQVNIGEEDPMSPTESVAHVFDIAEDSRAAQAAMTVTAFAAGFGAVEAARQNSRGATKTWQVNSTNPRASHAAMNGETVPVDEDFSNGLPWPGAVGAGADENAGCQCSLAINFP